MTAFDHLTDDAGLEGLADLEGRDIGLDIIHSPSHIGIDRHVEVANQDLTVGGLRHGLLIELEVIGGDWAVGAAFEQDAAICCAHGTPSMVIPWKGGNEISRGRQPNVLILPDGSSGAFRRERAV